MRMLIERIPVPFCGVMLAVAAIGTLLADKHPTASWTCGIVSFILLALIIAKICMFPRNVAADLNKPVFAAIVATFPMALLYQSTYVARIEWHAGFAVWIAALVLFILLMIRFTKRFALKSKLADLTPAFFVMYVGVLAASTTAPLYNMEQFGLVLSWIGFVAMVILVTAMTIRTIRCEPLPDQIRPLLCIFAAPINMFLAAYLSCEAAPPTIFVVVMFIASLVYYVVGLVALISCLKLPFYPSYSAMTFPFVISTAASIKVSTLFQGMGVHLVLFDVLPVIQFAIAAAAVAYVLVRYMHYLGKGCFGN